MGDAVNVQKPLEERLMGTHESNKICNGFHLVELNDDFSEVKVGDNDPGWDEADEWIATIEEQAVGCCD